MSAHDQHTGRLARIVERAHDLAAMRPSQEEQTALFGEHEEQVEAARHAPYTDDDAAVPTADDKTDAGTTTGDLSEVTTRFPLCSFLFPWA